MSHLELDFTLPIVLLVSAIAAVVVVRMLVAHGDKRAAARTARLVREHLDD